MTKITFLFFFCIGFYTQAQQVHVWVNEQYDPGFLFEHSLTTHWRLNGNVLHVVENGVDYTAKGQEMITATYAYGGNGYLSQVNRTLASGSHCITTYAYGKAGTFEQGNFYFVTGADTLIRQPITAGIEPKVADSLRKDKMGRTVYYRKGPNEVYTQFDAYGRKVKDSIPGNPTTAPHIIRYRYKKRKIFRTEHYPDQSITIKIIYWVDLKGNWVKCHVKGNRLKNVEFKRQITYR